MKRSETSSDFWSRRKAGVAAELDAQEVALVEAEQEEHEAQLAECSDEELLTEAGLKEPETLTSPEEVQEFLKSALPERLKIRALRRLWRLNPLLANLDGLVDYGEDFTDSALVIENMQTAYKVGKGMVQKILQSDVLEEADVNQDLALAKTTSVRLPGAMSDAVEIEELAEDQPDQHETEAEFVTAPFPVFSEDTGGDDLEAAVLPGRAPRMQFHFETQPSDPVRT